jgi:predicted NUDIX family phosphoesterase
MKILVTPSNIFHSSMMNDLTVGLAAVNLLDRIRSNPTWKERSLMEEDESYRQIITYTLIQHRETGEFLLSKRTAKQTEERLHNKYSIGIGGHVDFSGDEWGTPIINNAVKEVEEETGLKSINMNHTFQGIILTDVEPVDRVHVGVFFHLFTDYKQVYAEDGKHEHEWADGERLLAVYGQMERWSQIVFDSYISHI